MIALLYKTFLGVSTFLIIFTTRLHGYIDVPLFLLVLVFGIRSLRLSNSFPSSLVLPRKILYILLVLGFFSLYSSLISLAYGVQEIIWPLKFVRSLLLAFFLYWFYVVISEQWSYESFCHIVIWSVVVHSLVVYSAIIFPGFRDSLYGLTGYIPRGPAWSRSPGLTISFNATAIVHATAMLFIMRNHKWGGLKRFFAAAVIFPSFIFLGRFIFFLSVLLGFLYVFFAGTTKARLAGMASGLILLTLLMTYDQGTQVSEDTVIKNLSANLSLAISPLLNFGNQDGVDQYFQEHLSSHIFFSDRWYVLLFGNSRSGHIGLAGGAGETNSDLGVINSINANGVFITLFMVIFYIWFCLLARYGDWISVAFVCLLSVALSFKETGFFTSHATSLLFLILYYQILPGRSSRYYQHTPARLFR